MFLTIDLAYAVVYSLYLYGAIILVSPFLKEILDMRKVFKRLTVSYFVLYLIVGLVNWRILLGALYIFFLSINIAFHRAPMIFIIIAFLLLISYIVIDQIKKSNKFKQKGGR